MSSSASTIPTYIRSLSTAVSSRMPAWSRQPVFDREMWMEVNNEIGYLETMHNAFKTKGDIYVIVYDDQQLTGDPGDKETRFASHGFLSALAKEISALLKLEQAREPEKRVCVRYVNVDNVNHQSYRRLDIKRSENLAVLPTTYICSDGQIVRKVLGDNVHEVAPLVVTLSQHTDTIHMRPVVGSIIPDSLSQTFNESLEMEGFINPDLITTGSRIGSGSFGVVMNATCCQTPCAVKILDPMQLFNADDRDMSAITKKQRNRMFEEISVTRRLQHPSIARCMGVTFGMSGEWVMVMEVYSSNLSAHLSTNTSLPSLRIRDLLLPLARAVYFAHTQNVIHADIHTGNVLIDKHGDPFLTDFGMRIVQASGSRRVLNRIGHKQKTHEYSAEHMTRYAPELHKMDGVRATNQAVSPAADVYAFGALIATVALLHAASGKYLGSDWPKYLIQGYPDGVALQWPLPFRQPYPRGMPAWTQQSDICNLVMQCMDETAEKRPPMQAVVAELTRITQTHAVPLESSPPPPYLHPPSFAALATAHAKRFLK